MSAPTNNPTAARTASRSAQQIRAHYDVERDLADRLRAAPADQRRTLYTQLYDELFRRVPDHPQLARKKDPDWQRRQVQEQLELLERFLTPDTVFLELGAGDCSLSLAVAPRVRRVFALDVSPAIASQTATPDNFELIISDGTSIPVPPGSVTLAYSNQLMEHLHPDDALAQLRNVYTALAPGGRYLCITPNRLSGPHDISKYFDHEARGFHLKEYTVGELAAILREAGFASVEVYARTRGRSWRCPRLLMSMLELGLRCLPGSLRRMIATRGVVAGALGANIVGHKSRD